ncbi:MAG: hypothetical protein NTZ24_13675 [Deltaproteobacteria bacterium]|nr:hypothetical protein [Deltaproteobacteria bacterium]
MQRNIYVTIAALYLALQGFVPPTLAFEAAVLAPVRCDNAVSCGKDITIEEAKRLSVVTSATHTDCLKKHPETLDTCSLKTAVLSNECGKNYWAMVEDYPDGKAVLVKLIALAENGKPFHAWWPGGSQIVQSETSSADEKHLALCRVTEISGIAGPPKECATVAIITPEGTWLRGVDEKACTKMPSLSIGGAGAINIEFEILTKKSPLLFANKLKDHLVPRLVLTPQLDVYGSPPASADTVILRFTSPIRDSKILKGWRDTLDFTVRFHRKDNKVFLSGIAHPMVCQQNRPNISEFHGLDHAQSETYAQFLDNEVAAAIQSSCRHYEKKDSKIIACD